MRDYFDESNTSLKERWLKSRRAVQMLWMLPRETWPKFFDALCSYVRWLLNEKGNSEELSDFEENVIKYEHVLRDKIDNQELSEAEADKKRGDAIWYKAYEETEDTAFSVALGIAFKRAITAHLDKSAPVDERTPREIREEVERKIAEKLRELVNIDEA